MSLEYCSVRNSFDREYELALCLSCAIDRESLVVVCSPFWVHVGGGTGTYVWSSGTNQQLSSDTEHPPLVHGGWVAYAGPMGGSTQLFVRDPAGVSHQLTQYGSGDSSRNPVIEALGPSGSLMFTLAGKRYVASPGVAPRVVSNNEGTVRLLGDTWYLLLGTTLYQVSFDPSPVAGCWPLGPDDWFTAPPLPPIDEPNTADAGTVGVENDAGLDSPEDAGEPDEDANDAGLDSPEDADEPDEDAPEEEDASVEEPESDSVEDGRAKAPRKGDGCSLSGERTSSQAAWSTLVSLGALGYTLGRRRARLAR